jgi:hypothetical protein
LAPFYFILFVYFLKETVNSCHYIQLTLALFFNSLTGEEKVCGYCMQCSGTACHVNLPLATLEEILVSSL